MSDFTQSERVRRLEDEIEILKNALDQSLLLQAHYAELLNMYDDGQRIIFRSRQQWIDRLRETSK